MDQDILEEKKFSLDSRRWRHRRKMAYIALITGVLICLAAMGVVCFGSIERVKALSEFGAVFLGILGFLGGIVMAYIGTALVSDVKLWK
jgi:uncharacterized membrane protein